jgi:hypothetical protein
VLRSGESRRAHKCCYNLPAPQWQVLSVTRLSLSGKPRRPAVRKQSVTGPSVGKTRNPVFQVLVKRGFTVLLSLLGLLPIPLCVLVRNAIKHCAASCQDWHIKQHGPVSGVQKVLTTAHIC